jgi:uncharacterized membrane protein
LKTTITASQQSEKTRRMVFLAMFSAIIVIMALIPYVGYIPINPAITLTTLQIPVIIGAIMLGPVDGALLGLVFGVTSMIQAPFLQTPTAFLFNPFVPLGNYKSFIIAVVPRVLIGVASAYVYKFFIRFDKTQVFAAIAASIAGALTTSILVLSGIYIFFKDEFAAYIGQAASTVLNVLLGVFISNSLLEITLTAIVVPAIWKALSAAIKKNRFEKV